MRVGASGPNRTSWVVALLRGRLIVESSEYVQSIHSSCGTEPRGAAPSCMSRWCTAGRTAPQRSPCRFARPAVARFWEDGTAPADGRGHSRSRRMMYNTACYLLFRRNGILCMCLLLPCASGDGRRHEASLPCLSGHSLRLAGPGSLVEGFVCARVGVESRSAGGPSWRRWFERFPHVWAGGVVNKTQDRPSRNHRNHMVKTQNTLL